jgi:hypothetical protein
VGLPAEHLREIDQRLEQMSVARRLIMSLGFEPSTIELAIHREGDGSYTPERPALPFQFAVTTWQAQAADSRPTVVFQARAMISNHLSVRLPMPTTHFDLALALLPKAGAEDIYYRDAVSDAVQAAADAPPAWVSLCTSDAPHPAVRAEIERVFHASGLAATTDRRPLTLHAKVIGHRLTRRNDRYAAPGSDQWTLFRIVDPGDAWLALNLMSGWGELFSCGPDPDSIRIAPSLAAAIG